MMASNTRRTREVSSSSTAMAATDPHNNTTIDSFPSASNNENNNEMIASDIADVSTSFGQQLPAMEAHNHPQETRVLHTVGLDMAVAGGDTTTTSTQNNTSMSTNTLDSTITTTEETGTTPRNDDEGLLSNVVSRKPDNTNHNNKFNNNNNRAATNRYNNNSDSSSVVVGGTSTSGESYDDDDVVEGGEETMDSQPKQQILSTSTSLITRDSSPETEGDENNVTRRSPYFGDAPPATPDNNCPSFSSAGPAEAPTTRSTPTRRSTPIPSLELQPGDVTFQLQQQQRQAGISGTPNTTPTSAIMRTPPSPRAATVILPLPRVTVTSPSDLSPPGHDSSITLTMDEDDTVTHSPPSPQSPTSPTIPLTPPPTPPPPPPRSVVIIPMATNPILTHANGMIGIGMLDQPPDMIDLPPPPPYEGVVKADYSHRQSGNYGLSHMDNLPSYAVATDLPTYEEAERAKANEMRESRDQTTTSHLSNSSQQSGGSRYADDDRVPAYDPYHLTGVSIGTDWIFLCTFAISFLFNWLGFLISLCITNTVAGRCGALSGLGLSMVKWVVIMKHNTMAQGFLQGDSWVWWILMVCGFLLFLRGCIQYVNMKYEWKRIFTRLQQMYFS